VFKNKTWWSQTHIIFLCIILFVGIVYILTIPPLWGVDETTHFARAYQISTGRLMEQKLPDGTYGGQLPAPIAGLYRAVQADLSDNNPNNSSEVDSRRVYSDFEKQPIGKRTEAFNFIGSGVYSPLAYAAPSIGILIARALHPAVGSVILGARLATLALYATLVALALYLLRAQNSKWLIFVISLLPLCIFQASIVNVDSVAIGTSLLLFAQLLRLLKMEARLIRCQDVIFLALTALALTLTKPNYFILALVAPVVVFIKYGGNRKKALAPALIIAAVALIPGLIWNISVHSLITGGSLSQRPGLHLSPPDQLHAISTAPLSFIRVLFTNIIYSSWYQQSIGLLGFNFVIVPQYLMFLLTFILTLAAFISKERQSRHQVTWTFMVLGLLTALSIIIGFYLTYTPVSSKSIDGVQGRYFTPLAVFLIYSIIQLLPIRLKASERFISYFFPAAMVFCALLSIAWYYKVTY
jgi:uncharacterized membrane protein